MSQGNQTGDVADFIRRARKQMRKTLEAFGEEFGRTKANVHGWEKGLHEPPFAVLKQIAERSGVPLPVSVSEPGNAGSQAVSLAEALEAIGIELAKLPPERREAVAVNLAGWARDGGRGEWPQVLQFLLSAAPQAPRVANG